MTADHFGCDRNRRDGLTPWCKGCQARYRQERKAAGPTALCSIEGCGKPVAAQGLCSMHRWRLRQHGDPLYERPKATVAAADWKAHGLCTACGKPAVPGKTLCAAHLDKKRATYRAKRAQGLCGTCGRPLDADGHCASCAAYARGWRHEQKENGRCTSCGQQALPGLTSCAACAEGDRAKMERVRAERKAAGRCLTCGGEPEPGSTNCRACNDRVATWYKERKAAGLCVACDNAAVPGKTKCEACARADVEQMQELYQQRKAAGLCVSCGGPPLLGQVLCADCARQQKVYVREKQAKNVAKGMCIDCGQAEPAGTSTKCLVCYLKDRSVKLFRTNRRWQELLDLYERQQGRCAWSGLPITIGTDAYLDHILPRARRGTNDVANLQWLYGPVNRIKDCLTEEELGIVVRAMHKKLEDGADLPGVAHRRDELGDDFSARRGYVEPRPTPPVHRARR